MRSAQLIQPTELTSQVWAIGAEAPLAALRPKLRPVILCRQVPRGRILQVRQGARDGDDARYDVDARRGVANHGLLLVHLRLRLQGLVRRTLRRQP